MDACALIFECGEVSYDHIWFASLSIFSTRFCYLVARQFRFGSLQRDENISNAYTYRDLLADIFFDRRPQSLAVDLQVST